MKGGDNVDRYLMSVLVLFVLAALTLVIMVLTLKDDGSPQPMIAGAFSAILGALLTLLTPQKGS